MTETSKNVPLDPATPLRTLGTFLEEAPVLSRETVVIESEFSARMGRLEVQLPVISLYCGSKECDRQGYFDPTTPTWPLSNRENNSEPRFIYYRCRHCLKSNKFYALHITFESAKNTVATFTKIGEQPPAIGPTPRALQDLLGNDWNLFLKGRRAEIAGLGIGAFVYYRRVVEHIWSTVLEKLVEVAKRDSSVERLTQLQEAKDQPKFTRSMEAAKSAIPPSLYVDGHNPFQALYDACGEGLHELTDVECVRRAHIIRLVLTRFSERTKVVLAEDAEFRLALGQITNPN